MARAKGPRVGVYVNLRTGGFSLCLLRSDKTRGAVVAHARAVVLSDCRMVVSEGGRQRSVARFKEVHAWLSGELRAFDGTLTPAGAAAGLRAPWSAALERGAAVAAKRGRRVRYNPHTGATFVGADDGAPVHFCRHALAIDTDQGPRVYIAE